MASSVFRCRYGNEPVSVSFSGSGFMSTYQLGATQCLLNYVPWILRSAPFVLGASAGSLVAAAAVLEMSPIIIRDEILLFAKQVRSLPLGPLHPSINVFHWLQYVLRKHLPDDAHALATGRLAVAMTRLTDGKHIITTEYRSKEDVLQALLCSCFVPGYCGLQPPIFKGEYYMDGGFTGMQPVPPPPCGGNTLTVSPFSGESDICPPDASSVMDMVVSGATLKGNMANSVRILNALYPVTLESLEQAFYQGYRDTVDFLLRNDLAPYLALNQMSLEPRNLPNVEEEEEEEENTDDGEEENEDNVKEAAEFVSFTDNTDDELQNKHSPTPELVFWTWHCFRNFLVFFISVFFYTCKKNMKHRVEFTVLLLQCLKILFQEHFESTTFTLHSSLSSDASENVRHEQSSADESRPDMNPEPQHTLREKVLTHKLWEVFQKN